MFSSTQTYLATAGVSAGDLKLGASASDMGKQLAQPIKPHGYTRTSHGITVRCFDTYVCSLQFTAGIRTGYDTSAPQRFSATLRTHDGLSFASTMEEVLNARPDPTYVDVSERAPRPVRLVVYPGISFRFDVQSGAMASLMLATDNSQVHARMEAYDRAEEAILQEEHARLEGLRDEVEEYDLFRPLAFAYDDAPTWEYRAALIGLVQDAMRDEWRPRMRHFLDAPVHAHQDAAHYAKVIAALHLENAWDNFDAYWESAAVLEDACRSLRERQA